MFVFLNCPNQRNMRLDLDPRLIGRSKNMFLDEILFCKLFFCNKKKKKFRSNTFVLEKTFFGENFFLFIFLKTVIVQISAICPLIWMFVFLDCPNQRNMRR